MKDNNILVSRYFITVAWENELFCTCVLRRLMQA
jgi:hypothetical protein